MKYQKQFDFISKYSIVTILAVAAFVFMRVVEFLVFKYSLRTEPSVNILFKYSIAYDALFVVLTSCILLIPIAIIAKYRPRTSFIIYGSTLCIIFIINLLLSHFFVSSRYLLTAIVLEYSLKELLYIAGSGISGQGNPVWWLYVSIPFSILLCFLANKNRSKLIEHLSFAIWLFGVVALAFQIPQGLTKSIYSFNRRGDYYMSNNKLLFLGKSIVHRINFRSNNDVNFIDAYHNSRPEFTFHSNDFPLIHTEAYKNVLGDFFKPDSTPPNIVIIMAEGIGNYFAGLNSTSRHVLPFIDSLAANGLYWENFLSNCCRTYGFMPNALASLPPGTIERGFMNFNGSEKFGKLYPNHNSLFKELKDNGYHSSYYYGGWGYFDYMQLFVNEQGIDVFFDDTNFDSTKYISPKKIDPNTFYWGYDDASLFSQWFDSMNDSLSANQPFISLIMTLNNHEPFNISPKEYYDKDFLKHRAKKYGIDSAVVDGFDINVLASVFSFEDALRNFLNSYKNRPDYNNTIFIISGDHYSYRAAIDNPLGVYHVPFIIYSPLIAKHKTFGGVSTHIDVTPSIIALLEDSYGLKFSKNKHWLSAGFDTSSTFRCNTIAHLNAYSTDYPNFIYKNYLLSNSEVFRIEKNFNLVPVANADTIKIVQNYFESYKALDYYVCNSDRIWSSN